MTRTSFALTDENAVRELMEEEQIDHWVDVSRAEDDDELIEEYHKVEELDRAEFNAVEEAKQLFHIALPSILIQFSLFFIFPQSASAVGRLVGTVELAGFSLGSLIGNMTCLSILEGALTAGDTLIPRAYGSHRYEEVARLTIRAAVVCFVLLVPPVVPLCFYSERLLVSLGQDPTASMLAQEWIRIYFLGVPPNLLYRVAMRFLLAQHKPWPHVYSSVIPCLVLHPILLKVLVPRLGLTGSALAISLTQWAMALMLAVHMSIARPHKPETWPGLSFKLVQEALRPEPLLKFFSLSLGGVFSLSEWWFWELMCFIAGSFGVVSLVAHTIAYNLVPLLFMLPLGVMVGLAVRMGHVIAHDPHRAQKLAAWCMGFIIVAGLVIASLLYFFRLAIIHLFTPNDQAVIAVCLRIWPCVCAYIFLLYIFGISNAIYRGLGMQWRLAIITTGMLYLFLLPAVVYFAMIRKGGLYTQWALMPAFYTLLQIVLAAGYVVVDWTQHSKNINASIQESMQRSATLKTGNLQGFEQDERQNGSQADVESRDAEIDKLLQPSEQTPLLS